MQYQVSRQKDDWLLTGSKNNKLDWSADRGSAKLCISHLEDTMGMRERQDFHFLTEFVGYFENWFEVFSTALLRTGGYKLRRQGWNFQLPFKPYLFYPVFLRQHTYSGGIAAPAPNLTLRFYCFTLFKISFFRNNTTKLWRMAASKGTKTKRIRTLLISWILQKSSGKWKVTSIISYANIDEKLPKKKNSRSTRPQQGANMRAIDKQESLFVD